MKAFASLALALAWASILAPSVFAEEKAAGEDPVLAVVDGTEIRRSEVVESARSLPPEYQAQIEAILPALVERFVDLKLLGDRAEASGLDDDAEVKETMAKLQQDVVREVYLRRYLKERVTDEVLQARYQDFLKANPPQPEVHARHILVPTKEEAEKVIEQLDSGKEFTAVAAEASKGGSAQNGGDLGWFVKGDMVPEFADAAFAIEPGQIGKDPVETQFGWHVIKVEERRDRQPGQIGKDPVETQFGWHVIKVEERRDRQPPSFEEVKGKLESEAQQELVTALLQELRKDAEIEIKTPAALPTEGGATPPPEEEEGTDQPVVQ